MARLITRLERAGIECDARSLSGDNFTPHSAWLRICPGRKDIYSEAFVVGEPRRLAFTPA